MKANQHAWILLLFLLAAITFRLPAQQSDADSKAFEEAKAKAEKGDAVYQAALGEFYYFGGPERTNNLVEAVKWFRKAAEQGVAEAQFNLGCAYANGEGVTKDVDKAVKWYRKAAEQSYPSAQCSLGLCYDKGEGVIQDKSEAIKWYRKAAIQGVAEAQFDLGFSYAQGDGVIKDASEAVRWYRKAAEQGLAQAQCLLATKCYLGEGTIKDYVEACKWLNVAAAQGEENAKMLLQGLEQRMTTEQIAMAQQMAREFKPSKTAESGTSILHSGIFNSQPTGTGSGFFITDDGYLISNYHVVKDATKVRLLTSAGLIDAKVVQVDAANDLALLKADGRFAPLPIAASRTVALGGTVATVGFPDIGLQGFAPKLAKGEIASLSGAGDDPRYFQISVPVQPGNSGGALVDERGNVVGIVSAKLKRTGGIG